MKRSLRGVVFSQLTTVAWPRSTSQSESNEISPAEPISARRNSEAGSEGADSGATSAGVRRRGPPPSDRGRRRRRAQTTTAESRTRIGRWTAKGSAISREDDPTRSHKRSNLKAKLKKSMNLKIK